VNRLDNEPGWSSPRGIFLGLVLAASGFVAVSCGPPPSVDPRPLVQHVTLELGGQSWLASEEAARAQARGQGRPLLIYFRSGASPACESFERSAFSAAAVQPEWPRYVRAALHTDRPPIPGLSSSQRDFLSESHVALLLQLTGRFTVPCLVVLAPDGEVRGVLEGTNSPEELSAFLRDSSETATR
jgi:hypothetical protein